LAGAILYGLTVGVRTSRKLEDACRHRVDFMWLVEGRTIDHSTFAGFRKDFGRRRHVKRRGGPRAVRKARFRCVKETR
jgi:transposase